MKHITSRDNPFIKHLRRLAQDSTAYRKTGQVWLEGDHLCRAALTRGVRPLQAVFAASAWESAALDWPQVLAASNNGSTLANDHANDHSNDPPNDLTPTEVFVVPDDLFDTLSQLESPARMGFVVALPGHGELASAAAHLQPQTASVVLDRLQDAGNVGAILRSASAFGFRQVLAIKGTAALWSPKVLRAGMGAHFGLHLVEGLEPSDLQHLQVPLWTTSSHQGPFLHDLVASQSLTGACAWVLGHEGQGVSEALQALASQHVRIAQPGGEESLNVAAAAAICLHASATA
jgi:TrmH family RNA methyltransferase